MNRHLVYALENYHEERIHHAKERDEDLAALPDSYVLVSEGADGRERYFSSTIFWTPNPGNAKKLHIEGDLFDVMRALEGIKYHIVRLSTSGVIEDVTDEMMDKFLYDHLGNPRPRKYKKEEKDMPEETGSKRVVLKGSSKEMIERGQMKLYRVKYSFTSAGRFGHGFHDESEMTFLHRGEEPPSEDALRFEMQLRGEHSPEYIQGIKFGKPKELSFHQVKMSDLSLHQFIEIQAALMKGEL